MKIYSYSWRVEEMFVSSDPGEKRGEAEKAGCNNSMLVQEAAWLTARLSVKHSRAPGGYVERRKRGA